MKRSEAKVIHPFQRLQITLGHLINDTPAGERLPAEPELARQLGVSRATLREAMRAFESQGVIRRRQGVGTFVVSHSQIIDNGLEVLESIETMAQKTNLQISMGELRVSSVEADEEHAEALEIPLHTPLLHISRVIHANSRPVAYLIDILPEGILEAEELKNGFTGSVLDLMLHKNSPGLANALTEIRPVSAAPEIARALEIQRGDVLLMLQSRLFGTHGQVIDFSFSYFLPGYFRFHVIRRVGNLS